MSFLIECEKIGKSFAVGKHRLDVLKDLSLQLAHREWMMLIGSSGSGKTTLLNILGTLERPDAGTLYFNGRPYADFKASELRSRKIGFVFQSYHLLPELSVLENVMLPARLSGDFNCRERAEYLIGRVGLAERIRHRPGELSGGECQRAAIARALVNSPELLLADEPTGNLDAASGNEVMALFSELHADRELPVAIIMITHNPLLARFADRTLELFGGRLHETKETRNCP